MPQVLSEANAAKAVASLQQGLHPAAAEGTDDWWERQTLRHGPVRAVSPGLRR